MKKIFFLLLISLCALSQLSAQTEDSVPNPRILFGLHAGASMGYGFAYRQWTKSNTWGFQAATFPIFFDSHSVVNIGLSGFYNLRSNFKHRFYVWAADHTLIMDGGKDALSIAGCGPGMEFSGKYLTFSLQVGCMDSFTDKIIMPTLEIGLFYNIK